MLRKLPFLLFTRSKQSSRKSRRYRGRAPRQVLRQEGTRGLKSKIDVTAPSSGAPKCVSAILEGPSVRRLQEQNDLTRSTSLETMRQVHVFLQAITL